MPTSPWRPRQVRYKTRDIPFSPKFHYGDFSEASRPGSFGEVAVMEFGLKGTSRVCRGRHREVGIVEFGLYARRMFWMTIIITSEALPGGIVIGLVC